MSKEAWFVSGDHVARFRHDEVAEVNYATHLRELPGGGSAEVAEVYVSGFNTVGDECEPVLMAQLMAVAVLQKDWFSALALADWLQENVDPRDFMKLASGESREESGEGPPCEESHEEAGALAGP